MATFFCRLNAPRATFLQDMAPEEMQVMMAHGAYWREWMGKGNVIAFGVVGDPKAPFGMGVVEFDDSAAVQAFADNDPTMKSGRGFSFDIFPMPMGVVRA